MLAAGEPLLTEAQDAGQVKADLRLEQILELVIAVAKINGDLHEVAAILQVVTDGLRPSSGG